MNSQLARNDISGENLFKDVKGVLNLGLDDHYRQVTVAMLEDGGRIKSAGKMTHVAFLNWVRQKLAEGWEINSCYEAGACGYWLHRELVKLGSRTWWWSPKRWVKEGRSKRLINTMPGSCATAWI